MASNGKSPKAKAKVYTRDPDSKKNGAQNGHESDDSDAPEDPLFEGFASAEIGSMPELMALLQDDEILDRFQDPTTTNYLRQISMDPSAIDSLLEKPEIAFLVAKIKAQYEKTAQDRGTP